MFYMAIHLPAAAYCTGSGDKPGERNRDFTDIPNSGTCPTVEKSCADVHSVMPGHLAALFIAAFRPPSGRNITTF